MEKQTLEEQIKEEHLELLEEAAEMGKQDGGINVPYQDDEIVSPFEKKLKSKYQSLVDRVGANKEKELSSVNYEKISSLRKERDGITQEDIDTKSKEVEEREVSLLANEQSKYVQKVSDANTNAKFKSAQAKQKLADREFKKQSKIENRSYTNKTFHSNWGYGLILFFIGVAELAVNYETFQQFGKNLIITMVMALSFIIVPLIAHFVGSMVKQWGHNKRRASYTLMPLFGTAFVGIMFYYVASLSTVGKSGDADTNLWIFYILSMLLYLGGVLLAYAHVDSSDSFYKAFIEKEKADKAFDIQEKERARVLDNIEKEYTKTVEGIKDDYEVKRTNAKNIISLKNEAINSIVARYNEIISLYRKIEENVNSLYEEAVQEYRYQNTVYRPTAQPVCWREDVVSLNFSEVKFLKQD